MRRAELRKSYDATTSHDDDKLRGDELHFFCVWSSSRPGARWQTAGFPEIDERAPRLKIFKYYIHKLPSKAPGAMEKRPETTGFLVIGRLCSTTLTTNTHVPPRGSSVVFFVTTGASPRRPTASRDVRLRSSGGDRSLVVWWRAYAAGLVGPRSRPGWLRCACRTWGVALAAANGQGDLGQPRSVSSRGLRRSSARARAAPARRGARKVYEQRAHLARGGR